MQSLFVTPMPPFQTAADFGGQHRRSGAFIRALGQISKHINLVHIVPDQMMGLASDQVHLNATQSAFWQVPVHVTLLPRRRRKMTAWNYYGAGILSAKQQCALYPYSSTSTAEQVGDILDSKPDLVFVDRLDAMLPVLASKREVRRLVFDVGDVYHRVMLRSAMAEPFAVSKRITTLQAPSLVLAERRAVARSDMAFVCSNTDVAHLRRLGFPSQIRAVPNAMTIPREPSPPVSEPTVLYLGSFYHPPNVLAAERLVNRIWPRVQAQIPAAQLLIAGADSERLPSRAAKPAGVTYLGFVDDLDSVYARSRLVCTPIMTGSGTRLKLLEAAAYGRPMVSTRIGAEGLDFRDGHEIMLREDDAALAAACVDLLTDNAMCARYGAAARAMVLDRYDVRRIEQSIVSQFQEVCNTSL